MSWKGGWRKNLFLITLILAVTTLLVITVGDSVNARIGRQGLSRADRVDSLSNILQKIDRGEGTIGALVNSSTTVEELDELLASARDAVAEIRVATEDLPPTMASIRQVAAEAAQVVQMCDVRDRQAYAG